MNSLTPRFGGVYVQTSSRQWVDLKNQQSVNGEDARLEHAAASDSVLLKLSSKNMTNLAKNSQERLMDIALNLKDILPGAVVLLTGEDAKAYDSVKGLTKAGDRKILFNKFFADIFRFQQLKVREIKNSELVF